MILTSQQAIRITHRAARFWLAQPSCTESARMQHSLVGGASRGEGARGRVLVDNGLRGSLMQERATASTCRLELTWR